MTIINRAWFWWVALALFIGLELFSAIKAYRRHGIKGLRYDLKRLLNSLTPMLSLLLAAYFIIISLIPMQAIVDFALKQSIGLFGLRQVLVKLIPLAYTIIVLILVVRILFFRLVPLIKYNTEEMQWKKEADGKFNSKIRELLHLKSENVTK